MAQPVAQPPDRPPRLFRKQFLSSVSQAECRLADAFQAAFDRIVSKVVVSQPISIHAFNIPFDPRYVVDDILQAVCISVIA
jgi:hypothetical protein